MKIAEAAEKSKHPFFISIPLKTREQLEAMSEDELEEIEFFPIVTTIREFGDE